MYKQTGYELLMKKILKNRILFFCSNPRPTSQNLAWQSILDFFALLLKQLELVFSHNSACELSSNIHRPAQITSFFPSTFYGDRRVSRKLVQLLHGKSYGSCRTFNIPIYSFLSKLLSFRFAEKKANKTKRRPAGGQAFRGVARLTR